MDQVFCIVFENPDKTAADATSSSGLTERVLFW